MDDFGAAQTSAADIAESKRCCWKIGCKRTARLEHMGWRWCFRHYWTQDLSQSEGWRNKLTTLRWTRPA